MKPTNNQFVANRAIFKNRFAFLTWIVAIVLSWFSAAVCLRAQETTTDAGAAEGEKMERQMWADFKAKDWKAVESKIAEGFQSIHPDGPRDRAGEIALIEHLNLGEFTLSNFKTTVNGENIVVSYVISVPEAIGQQRLPAKRATALRVWKRGCRGGQ